MLLRQLTDEETKELKRMTRQEIGRVSQRAHMILLMAQGRMYTEIARIFETTTVTIVTWIGRFNPEGPAGLYDQPRSGRPHKATKEVIKTIGELICDDPQREGYVATFWMAAVMILALVGKLRVRLSPTTVRALFKELDLRWGRPRLGMPNTVDPQKAHKQWLIAKTVIKAGPGAAILYGDEWRVQLLPLIRAMSHWVGQQIRVPTPGTNDWRALFGALNIRTGQWTYLQRCQMKKEDFIAFLDHLLVVYPTEVIVLIVDNYSSHTAGVVTEWLRIYPRLHLPYLPKYCSRIDLVEQFWLRMKDKVAANRLYGSMRLLLDAVAQFYREMSPEQALEWAAA